MRRFVLLTAAAMLLLVVPQASAATIVYAGELDGSITTQSGSILLFDCTWEEQIDNPNGTSGDTQLLAFGGSVQCSRPELSGSLTTGHAELLATLGSPVVSGTSFSSLYPTTVAGFQEWGNSSTGTYQRPSLTTLNQIRFTFHLHLNIPPGATGEINGGVGPATCTGVHTADVTCVATSPPFAFAPYGQQLTALLTPYENQLLGLAGYGITESQCAAGQALNPDPARGDSTCRTVGGAVKLGLDTANGGVGTVVGLANNGLAEGQCVAGQALAPDPARGDSTCRTVGGGIKTAENAAGSTLTTLVGAASGAVAEAGCAAGQVTNPSSNGDSTCQAVGTAVKNAENEAGYAGTESGCLAGQVTAPDPSHGDSACQTAGSISKQVRDQVGSVADIGGTPSGSCTTGQVADGYAGTTYVKLRTQQSTSDPSTTWICYQLVSPNGASVGGRLDVKSASASPTLPSQDDLGGACAANTATSAAPPPHPLLAGNVSTISFSIDDYTSAGVAWLCVQAGPLSKRVVVNVPGVGVPTVTSHVDEPNTGTGPPSVTDPQAVSGSCQNGVFGPPDQLLNTNIGGTQAWLYDARSDGGRTVHVCARINGAVRAGGMLTVSTAGSPGVMPTITPVSNDADLSIPCPTPLVGLTSPVEVTLRTSDPGVVPASVCIKVGATQERVTVGTAGSVVPPTVNWQSDSDTPA